MSLTREERSEINRKNAANSTGPRTAEGKARSRMNAVTHGLRSEVVAIEGEDPAAVAARVAEWEAYYQPQSPAARYLALSCVRATLFGDRLERCMGATLSKQVRESKRRQFDAIQDEVVACVKLLETDPAEAVAALNRSAHGCRYLIGRWKYLRRQLTTKVRWSETERDDAIRLQGLDPSWNNLRCCERAFLTRMYSELCRTNKSERLLQQLFDARAVPDAYRGVFTPEEHPEPEVCRESLLNLIERELEDLDRILPELAALEAADRVDAPARAAVVTEGPEARLLLRYQSEALNAFLKNYSALEKALAADAARVEADPRPESPNEPNISTESSIHERNPSPHVEPEGAAVHEPQASPESPNEPNISTKSLIHERMSLQPEERPAHAHDEVQAAPDPTVRPGPTFARSSPGPILLAS